VVPGFDSGSSLVRISYTNTTVAGCPAQLSRNLNASPYVDYNTDAAYVADSGGRLYRITGVFNGTPTLEYCITVSPGANMTSPLYDQVNNVVYTSDGYYVYGFTPGATGFTPAGSIQVASTLASDPIVFGTYLDSTDGFVYIFSAADLTNSESIVSQIDTSLSSQVTADLGPKATPYLLSGDFDNEYWTQGPMSGAGTLYACGTDAGGNGSKPSLYALSFTSPLGLMNSTPVMSDNRNINNSSNSSGSCSPFLDFYDGTTDRLFIGAGNYSNDTGANQVTEWDVNTRITSNTAKPNATAPGYWGGSSAFCVDNVSIQPQAASIYFGTLQKPPSGTTTPCGAGNYCAVKLTQNGLQ